MKQFADAFGTFAHNIQGGPKRLSNAELAQRAIALAKTIREAQAQKRQEADAAQEKESDEETAHPEKRDELSRRWISEYEAREQKYESAFRLKDYGDVRFLVNEILSRLDKDQVDKLRKENGYGETVAYLGPTGSGWEEAIANYLEQLARTLVPK
jgi:flagellar biosynthesis GTPase FlhF